MEKIHENCSCRNRICRIGSRCMFCGKGHDVTCVDVDEKKVKLMESGVTPIYEEGLEELMKKIMQLADFIIQQIIKVLTKMQKLFLSV